MALPDYPPLTVRWDTGLTPEMLQALGNLAVSSAQAEELLHQIYWNHAGLNEQSGPIVTDNLNPKRLQEDILKLVALDRSKANILADLKLLFAEHETLNTKRNHCLHWIWEGADRPPESVITEISAKPVPYKLKRPIYRQSGVLKQEVTVPEVKTYCSEFSWLAYRLRSHTFSDEELRQKRREVNGMGTVIGPEKSKSFALADLFWPAPWLDKPLPLVPTPPDHPGTQK
jgi:hypothetical protein